MTQFHKKDAAAKILKDESGSKGHSIKKHLMQGPATGGKGITQPQLEKRTNAKATPTVTAFNKPSGLAKAVKTAMNSPDYKPGTAQEITVPLTPHKATGKQPSITVASKDKRSGEVTTQKMAATQAKVKFNEKGELFRVTVPKSGMQPKAASTPTTGAKPAKPAPQTLQQMAAKAPKTPAPTTGGTKSWASVAASKPATGPKK